MNYNNYAEITNGEDTYRGIAFYLKMGETVGIAWTDEISTHFDIVFKLGLNVKHGEFQRGIKQDYLYISIIDHTAFAFRTDGTKATGYIQEKLRMKNETGEALADLINGIITELNR